MQERAKYILVEGIEGAGKSSVMESLKKQLEAMGREYIVVQEPGSTPLGQQLRTILKESKDPIEPLTEAMLFAAARRQLWVTVVQPALLEGKVVLSDRGLFSSYAYQGGGRDCYEQVLDLASITFGGAQLVYDLTIYLDVPPAVGLARAAKRGELDRIEGEGLEFIATAHEYYEDLFQTTEIAKYTDAIKRVDASLPLEDVCKASCAALLDYLEEEEGWKGQS